MTNRETLRSLADACEALSGPCRETDALIALALGIVRERDGNCFYGHRDYSVLVLERGYYDHDGNAPELPRYTASIDSAMSLADPSWWLNINGPLTDAAYGYSREDQRIMRAGFQMIGAPYSAAGRTAITGDVIGQIALALTAASLRAIGEGL